MSEYRFEMEAAAGRDSGTEWRIVDVGGSRSQVRYCRFRTNQIILIDLVAYSVVSETGIGIDL